VGVFEGDNVLHEAACNEAEVVGFWAKPAGARHRVMNRNESTITHSAGLCMGDGLLAKSMRDNALPGAETIRDLVEMPKPNSREYTAFPRYS
jgi:hypothetical protein